MVWTDHNPLVQAFRVPNTQSHDVIAQNHINEISQWTNDVRFISGKANAVSDFLSRPPDVRLGSAYQMDPENGQIAAQLEESADVTAANVPPANVETADGQSVAFATVDHRALAAAQAACPEIELHKKGKHLRNVTLDYVEFSPRIFFIATSATGRRPDQ